MSNRDLKQIAFEYKTLDGKTRKVDLIPLRRKEAARVFHETLVVILHGISGATKENPGRILTEAINALSFDKLYELGNTLLKDAIIDGEEIRNLDDTEIFEENPEELYIVLFHAIKENYPNFFTRVASMVNVKDVSNLFQGQKEKK